MVRDSDVVLCFIGKAGQPGMTSSLPGWLVAKLTQVPDKFLSTYLPWNFHAAMTSSFTI